MKTAHFLSCRAICESKDAEETISSLHLLLHQGKASEKCAVIREPVHDSTKVIVRMEMKQESLINSFFKFLSSSLPAKEKKQLCDSPSVNDHCDFAFRIDRKEWMAHKSVMLTSSGDCFHFTINMAAYPRTKDRAIEVVGQIFKTEP